MDKSIRFMNVTKRYKLGLTRASLPALVSEKVSSVFKGNGKNISKSQYLLALNDVSFELGKANRWLSSDQMAQEKQQSSEFLPLF